MFGSAVALPGPPAKLLSTPKTQTASEPLTPSVELETDEGIRRVEGALREDVPRLVADAVAAGRQVYGVRVLTSTLEDVYLEAVGAETS